MPSSSFSRESALDLNAKARASVDEATPDTYFKLVEEITHDQTKIDAFKSHWSEADTKKALKIFAMPDLATAPFVDFKQEGEWAGYYFLSDLEDTANLSIAVTRFHQLDGVWRIYPRGGALTVPAPETEAERASIIKQEMAESDALRVKPE